MSRLIFSFLLLLGSLAALEGHAKSMTKTDLVAFVASRAGLSPTQAAEAVDAMLDGITQTLVDGGDVRIAGFGTFAVIRRPERAGRDTRTGERLVIPAYKAPKFKAGKELNAAVRNAAMAAPTDKSQHEGMSREPMGAAPSGPGQVMKVTDESFEHDVLKAPGPILLVYWAEWSGPNKMMAPALEEVAAEMVDRLTVVKINIDENPMTPQTYGVRGIPTLMLFKDGHVTATKVGVLPKDQLIDWLDASL